MQTDMFGQASSQELCLDVVSIVGEVRERGDFLNQDSVDEWSLENSGFADIEAAKVQAERVSLLTGKECWVVNRSNDEHNRRVVYRFSVKEHVGAVSY